MIMWHITIGYAGNAISFDSPGAGLALIRKAIDEGAAISVESGDKIIIIKASAFESLVAQKHPEETPARGANLSVVED